MKKIVFVALLMPALAFGQGFPTPTFSSMTLQNPLSTANGGTGATTSTGAGSVVLSNSPTLVTPNLGTPSAVTLTNGTGLPVSTGISGLGTGVATALGSAVSGSGGAVLTTSPTIASPTISNPVISGAISGTTSVTVPAQLINFESGITPLTGVTLPVSAGGESPGSSYLAGGAMSVSDNSSHAGRGHILYGFFTTPIGTGAIGPLNADIGVMISALKQNFNGVSPNAGEIDGQYNFVRNGGSNSDTTGALFDVANTGTGFNAIFEGVTSAITGGSTIAQQTDVQAGVVDTRGNTQFGFVATKFIGTGGVAFLGQQSAGQWQHLLQFTGSSQVLFDMPISAGNVVTMEMFDGTGGSKTLGVQANTFRFLSSTGAQIFTLDDSGNVATGGNLTTADITAASGTFDTLNAGGNDALLYTNTSGQSFASATPATVTTWSKKFDRVNANFNAATGVFTAPATGYYSVSAQITFGGSLNGVGNVFEANVIANAVTVASGFAVQQGTGTIPTVISLPSVVVSLTAGQTITLQVSQTTGAARTLSTSAGLTYLSINRIP